MQPLQLKAYLKPENKIIDIPGYEVVGEFIRIFDGNYFRTMIATDIKILHCTGIKDVLGDYCFEDELVEIEMDYPDVTFVGVVTFLRGRFTVEGKKYVCFDWPTTKPGAIRRRGNINTDSLDLKLQNS